MKTLLPILFVLLALTLTVAFQNCGLTTGGTISTELNKKELDSLLQEGPWRPAGHLSAEEKQQYIDCLRIEDFGSESSMPLHPRPQTRITTVRNTCNTPLSTFIPHPSWVEQYWIGSIQRSIKQVGVDPGYSAAGGAVISFDGSLMAAGSMGFNWQHQISHSNFVPGTYELKIVLYAPVGEGHTTIEIDSKTFTFEITDYNTAQTSVEACLRISNFAIDPFQLTDGIYLFKHFPKLVNVCNASVDLSGLPTNQEGDFVIGSTKLYSSPESTNTFTEIFAYEFTTKASEVAPGDLIDGRSNLTSYPILEFPGPVKTIGTYDLKIDFNNGSQVRTTKFTVQ